MKEIIQKYFNNLLTPKTIFHLATGIGILLLPYVIFFWMLPAFSDQTIGNDYQVFPIQQQIELQYSLENGQIPLYVPGFAKGHSATALTLGQLYHPVRILAAMLPGYWEGGALTANTISKLLGIGLVHLMAFYFFISLRLRKDFSFILSFIAVYNLRMLDMFRYGASLENYLAYIMVCVALGFLYLQNHRTTGIVAIAISTYLLCVGGHPQMMYIGLLGVGACYIVLPFVINDLRPDIGFSKKKIIQFYLHGAAGIFFGIALAAVYILPFYFEFVKANTIRVGQGYEWSLAYSDSWGGAMGSLFRPLNADVHTAFGGTSLLAVVSLFPVALLARRRFSVALGVLWVLILVVFLVALGGQTPLHRVFWEYFPLASSFRTPGRMTMMLAMPMSLLLAWLFGSIGESIRLLRVPLHVWVGAAALALMIVFNNIIIHHIPEPSHYIPARILELPGWVEPRLYLLGIITLILLMAHGVLSAIPGFTKMMSLARNTVGLILIVAVIAQTGICMRFGTWVAPARETVTWEQLTLSKKHSVDFTGNAGFGMELPIVTTQMAKSILDPSLARIYRKVKQVDDMSSSFDTVTRRNPDEVVIEYSGKLPKRTDNCKNDDTIALTHNTFNALHFNVNTCSESVMTVNYPALPGWKARVDNKDAEVLPANGYQIAAMVPAGEHTVIFEYHSKSAVVGMAITALALFGLLVLVAYRAPAKRRGFAGAAIFIAGGTAALFALWMHGTHSGKSIGTEYSWRSAQMPPIGNLAYAKTTRASSINLSQMPYYFYAGSAVDGDFGGRGWRSHPRDRSPYWQVDLGEQHQVQQLLLTGVSGRVASAQRPLHVQISREGERFKTHRLLKQRPETVRGKWAISMEDVSTRFIRLWAPGPGGFGLREVEVSRRK